MRTVKTILVLFVALALQQPWRAAAQVAEPKGDAGQLTITAINLSMHGLSLLIQTPSGKAYLVDTGEACEGEATLQKFLQSRGIARLDGLVISHPHTDHFRSAPYLLERFRIDALVLSPFDQSRAAREDQSHASLAQQIREVNEIRRLAEKRGVKVIDTAKGDTLQWDPALRIEVLWPPKEPFLPGGASALRAINDNSLVLRIAHGDLVILLPGDIRDAAGGVLAKEQPEKVKADLLIAPHHGMFTSQAFAAAAKPRVLVASCALNEGGPHTNFPAISAVKLFAPLGARIYATAWQGEVRVESDGRKMHITTKWDG